MSIRRITFSIPEATARKLKRAAGKRSVSEWITEAVESRLTDADLERQFEEWYARVAPTPAQERRAAAWLDRVTRPRSKRRRAA